MSKYIKFKKGKCVKVEIIESLKIKEKAYIEKLENGLTIIIIPKSSWHRGRP